MFFYFQFTKHSSFQNEESLCYQRCNGLTSRMTFKDINEVTRQRMKAIQLAESRRRGRKEARARREAKGRVRIALSFSLDSLNVICAFHNTFIASNL